MWDGNIGELRAQYLFALANLCSVTAAESWDLRVVDFAIYLQGIDEYLAAQAG